MSDVSVSIGASTADFDKAVASLSSTMTAQTSRMNAAVAGSMGSLKRELDQARRALERMALTDPGWSRQAAQVASLTSQLQRMQGAMRGQQAGGGGMSRLGGASMQIQDIAVQMQMGTRMSTIIAQQGSQMLSMFGPGGAILGGVVAVGGAFYMMGENAKKAFNDSKEAARTAGIEFEKAIKFGDVSAVTSQVDLLMSRWEAASNQFNKLQEDAGELTKTWIASLMGGPSVDELMKELNRQMEEAMKQREAAANRLVELSGKEADIAEMRDKGREKEADEMERQLKIAKETDRIQSLNIPQAAKDAMISDLDRRFMAAQSKGGSPFEPLKGDIDTSFGRGHQLNLRPEMTIKEMVRQSNLLKEQNGKIDDGNKTLKDIHEVLNRKRFGYASYN